MDLIQDFGATRTRKTRTGVQSPGSLNPSGHWSPWGPQGSKQKRQWKEGLGNGSLESLLRGRNGMNLDRKADDSRCGLGLGFI